MTMSKQEAGLVPERPSDVSRSPALLSSGSLAQGPRRHSTSLPPWSLVSAPGLNPLSYTLLGDQGAAGKGGEPPPWGLEQLDPSCILALYAGQSHQGVWTSVCWAWP